MEEHKDPDDPNATEWDLEAAEKNAAEEAQPEPEAEPAAEPEPETPADDTGETGDGQPEAGDGSDAAATPEGT